MNEAEQKIQIAARKRVGTCCIFCTAQSNASKSVEHIIPESLGNTRHVLAKGAVCDTCNNYFARKLEQPVLSHRSIRNLRARNGLRSKAGKLTPLLATHLSSGFDVAISREANGDINIRAERGKNSSEIQKHLDQDNELGLHAFAVNLEVDPPQREMSRLLAKMAIERCFSDLERANKNSDYVIFDRYFHNMRRWARYGDNFSHWPYHQRTIFPQDTQMLHPTTNEWVKVGIGQGLFHTPSPETYYSIVLYGTEFVINVGGPNIEGLEGWLTQNDNVSPYLWFSRLKVSIEHSNGEPRARLVSTK
jgi:hypothetical protein